MLKFSGIERHMPQIANLLNNGVLKRTAIGAGIAVAVPVAAFYLAPFVRPVARSTMKVGLVMFEKTRETAAEIGEIMEDLVAEVREDLRNKRERSAGAMIEPPNAASVAGEIDQRMGSR